MTGIVYVYPDPGSKTIYLNLPEKIDEGWEIKIIGFDGKQYMRQRINRDFGNEYPIDLSEIPTGLYIIVYQSEKDYKTDRAIVRN